MSFFYAKEDFSHFHLSGWNPFQSDIVKAVERLGLTRRHPRDDRREDRREGARGTRRRQASRSRGSTGHARRPAGCDDRRRLPRAGRDRDRGRHRAAVRPHAHDRTARSASTSARARIRKQRHRLLQIGAGTPNLETRDPNSGLKACAARTGQAAHARHVAARDRPLGRHARHQVGADVPARQAPRRRAAPTWPTRSPSQQGLLRRLQAQGLREAATRARTSRA